MEKIGSNEDGRAPQGSPPGPTAVSMSDVGHQLKQSEAVESSTDRKLSQSSDLSSESESTCTVLQRETRSSLSSVQKQFEIQEQILSAETLVSADGFSTNLGEDKSDLPTRENDNELVSVGQLWSAKSNDGLVEIDLNESLAIHGHERASCVGLNQQERKSGEEEEKVNKEEKIGNNGENMYHNHHRHNQQHGASQQSASVYRVNQQQQQDGRKTAEHNHLHHFRGFSEAPPKICFASRRMKEYFESFKGHGGETRRLYQFFKSIRTELVACFLFTLITSQALITCRTQLFTPGGDGVLPDNQQPSPSWWSSATTSGLDSSATQTTSIQVDGPNRKYPISVHLAQGVMVAFTVASLTQVFGHISGCHLIPSVSLALYVKGHISKGRLASYLAAQTVGSAMGVSLLSVLTSSQITPDEFRQSLESLRTRSLSRAHQLQVVSSVVPQTSSSPSMFLSGDRLRRRKRRDTITTTISTGESQESALQALPDSNSVEPLEGSETILLSIMEQQQELLGSKLKRQAAAATLGPTTKEPTISSGDEPGKTITANASTYSGELRQRLSVSAASPSDSDSLAPSVRLEPTWLPSTSPTSSNWPPPTAPNSNDRSRILASSRLLAPSSFWAERATTLASSSSLASPSPSAELLQQQRHRQQQQWRQQQQTETVPSDSDALAVDQQQASGSLDGPVIRRRRMKRNRQQAPSAEATTAIRRPDGNNADVGVTATVTTATGTQAVVAPTSYYINLLEFGLPEQIMSSESIRQCIDKQLGSFGQVNLSELASRGFSHCLSLSNSSQMFVFQFLATLLVVLTYLVNVDPRRVDVGFKSLSIGLAYFVAGLVTVQSGGFFGNPFQLIFLSWLSPTGEWQTEWFIYLATPLIGGLFGAISHEYIDFTSARNRNKQLHLRRSFYSLENLPAEGIAAPLGEMNTHTMMLGSSSSSNYGHHYHQNPMLQSSLGPATELPHSTVMSQPLVPAARHSRKISADSSSSLESAPSSILSLNTGGHQQQQQAVLDQQQQVEVSGRPKTPKKPNYAKQLKLEQQQQQLKAGRQQVNLCADEVTASSKSGQRMSLRRSDFDSNFLISSSSPTANPRNHFHQQHHHHHHQNPVTSTSGWM